MCCAYCFCLLAYAPFFSDRNLLGTKAHRSKIKKTSNRSGFHGQSLRLSVSGRARDKSNVTIWPLCRSRQEEAAFADLSMGLCVCVGLLQIVCIHQTWSVGEGSDHLQLIRFWPSHAPGKEVCGEVNNFDCLTTASVQCLHL